MIADTPKPPYYAVIFSSVQSNNTEGYAAMAEQMAKLARDQSGFLGMESARNELGITVSYWTDLESIKAWKEHSEHLVAQNKGRSEWYSQYKTRVSKVERDYSFSSDLREG